MAMTIELDIISYTLIAALLGLLFLPVLFPSEPDTHPLALEHQSQVSQIRQPKESAIYRSHETPHGVPLKKGLGLQGDKSWEKRNGDLRDVWKLAVEKGNGKVLSVKGVTVTEVEIAKITKWIHILGHYLTTLPTPTNRIALFQPNDIENLIVSFACHFYGLTLILIPHPSSTDEVKQLLTKTSPDLLVASAGNLALVELQPIQSLKNIIWIVEEASRNVDWNTPPSSRIRTCTLHDILADGEKQSTTPIPPEKVDTDTNPAIITAYVPLNTNTLETISFTHKNLIAGISAQLTSLPSSERFSPNDVFLPLDTLSILHPRIVTYTALAAGSTLALTSIATSKLTSIETACRPVSPTVILASPQTILHTILNVSGNKMEIWHQLIHWFQKRTLSHGRIPYGNWFTRFNDYVRPDLGTPHRLRLCLTYHLAITDSQPLNSPDLSDLRIYLRAKVVYALTSPKVAGPICQQNMYDYRREKPLRMPSRKFRIPRYCTHFGPPTAAVEVWLRDTEGFKVTDQPFPRGQVWVRGPSVVGPDGETRGVGLGVVGRWRKDGCLEFAVQG